MWNLLKLSSAQIAEGENLRLPKEEVPNDWSYGNAVRGMPNI